MAARNLIMKTLPLLLALVGALCLVTDNVALAVSPGGNCGWRGTAPSCGYYCNYNDNVKWLNTDKEDIATAATVGGAFRYMFYSSTEQCKAELGGDSALCSGFGAACSGGCKIYVCQK
jgi:hypothetical protein